MPTLDFSEPIWLINYYHYIGIISFILSFFGFYLLIYQSKNLSDFRYYLLTFQILCLLVDVHFTCLMQPVPLNPVLAGYTTGILNDWFGFPTHYSFAIGMFIESYKLEFLTLCFEKRHQAIANILHEHVLYTWFRYSAYFLLIISPFVVCFWLQIIRVSKEEQWKFIEKHHPEYLSGFQSLTNFELYLKSPFALLLMVAIVVAGAILITLFAFFISDMLRMMKRLKLKLSSINYQKHKEAIQSLIVQLLAASICFGPPFLAILLIISEIDNAQFIFEIFLVWFVTYSSINVVSLLIFFPPHRQFMLKLIRRDRLRNNVLVGGVSSVMLN